MFSGNSYEGLYFQHKHSLHQPSELDILRTAGRFVTDSLTKTRGVLLKPFVFAGNERRGVKPHTAQLKEAKQELPAQPLSHFDGNSVPSRTRVCSVWW